MSRIPTRTEGAAGERGFDLTLRLSYRALEGWDPVAPAHDFDHEPTQQECVWSQVAGATLGVLPDERGDEAATLVEYEVRDLGWCSCGAGIGVNASKCVDCTDALERDLARAARSRVPTRKQYEALRILARMAAALLPSKQEFGPLRRHGWTQDNPHLADRATRGLLPPQQITPNGLRALADAMERYEGEGGQ